MFKKLKMYFKCMDKTLLFVTLILFIFGLLNIVTASSREAVTNLDQSIFYYFFRHLAILIMGIVGFLIIIKTDTKKYNKLVPILFIIFLVLNAYLVLKGTATRGANNWINLGFFKLQPSEISKPIIIVALALVFEKNCKTFRNPKIKHSDVIGIVLFVGLLIPALVFLQKDLGTATILLVIFGVMFVASPILRQEKIKIIGFVLIIFTLGGFIMYSVQGYLLSDAQKSRLNFSDPCSRYIETGYQVCNAYIALNNGGLNGLGIGNSTQKYSYIPEPHTDMVFAIVAEENGVLKCSLIFLAYIIILCRIIRLSKSASSMLGQYICLGVSTYIFMHILINLGGLFGLIPLTGVPLPFLSYGGSFTLSLIAALAIVQRIHIEKEQSKLI